MRTIYKKIYSQVRTLTSERDNYRRKWENSSQIINSLNATIADLEHEVNSLTNDVAYWKKKYEIYLIYPILPEHIERIFQGKDVFCKYIGKGTPRLKVGSKLLFYASRNQYEVLGDAIIIAIESLMPDKIIFKYEDRLFITKEELDNYRIQRDRPADRKLMVLILSNIKKYDRPHRMLKRVSMAGQTLSKEEYKKLLSE